MGLNEILKDRIPKFRDPHDDVWQSLWRGGMAEFFAVAMFVFLGSGSVAAVQDLLGEARLEVAALTLISLAHGFAIMILVYSIGEVSGGNINPAITWALLLTNKMSVLRALTYWAFQLTGAVCGAAILRSLHPQILRLGLGCHGLHPQFSPAQGLWCEIVFTFIFVFVVFATAVSPFAGKMAPLSGEDYGPGKLTPFAIGMTIMCLHTVGIPMTGASMNPARSFGPAIVNGCWNNHWIYWVGPFIGSSMAAWTAQLIFLSHLRAITKVFEITRGRRTEAEPGENYGQLQEVQGQFVGDKGGQI